MVAATQFNFDELDEATKHYLRTVWKNQGRGLPGVYERIGDSLPWIGFFVGLAVIVATLLFTWAPLDFPLQTTFLQTAGVLVGGWMMAAAMRVWLGRSGGQVGHFVYADPARLWSVKGGKLDVIQLQGLTGVEARDNYNNEGAYQSTDIHVYMPEGMRTVQVASATAAARVVAYLQVLTVLPTQGPDWQNLSLAERGHRAREMAGELSDHHFENLSVVIPPSPRRVGGGGAWLLLALLATASIGVGLFFALYEVNLITRDDAIFDLVKDQKPEELRLYLLDRRTTRHRDQVKDILERTYKPSIAFMKASAKDPKLGAAFATVVETIATAPVDILTLRVTDKSEKLDVPAEPGSSPTELQKEMAKELTQAIGGTLVRVFGVPDEVQPMLEWKYRWAAVNDKYNMTWNAVFRTGPDEQPFLIEEGTGPQGVELRDVPSVTQVEMRRFVHNLVGARGEQQPLPNPNPGIQ